MVFNMKENQHYYNRQIANELQPTVKFDINVINDVNKGIRAILFHSEKLITFINPELNYTKRFERQEWMDFVLLPENQVAVNSSLEGVVKKISERFLKSGMIAPSLTDRENIIKSIINFINDNHEDIIRSICEDKIVIDNSHNSLFKLISGDNLDEKISKDNIPNMLKKYLNIEQVQSSGGISGVAVMLRTEDILKDLSVSNENKKEKGTRIKKSKQADKLKESRSKSSVSKAI